MLTRSLGAGQLKGSSFGLDWRIAGWGRSTALGWRIGWHAACEVLSLYFRDHRGGLSASKSGGRSRGERRQGQPHGMSSASSFFRTAAHLGNPPAGRLLPLLPVLPARRVSSSHTRPASVPGMTPTAVGGFFPDLAQHPTASPVGHHIECAHRLGPLAFRSPSDPASLLARLAEGLGRAARGQFHRNDHLSLRLHCSLDESSKTAL